ncbi:aspartate--tRNA ligase [Pichia kluyveri]|uniref:Aspartate--tRNA ligase n=1 Tax=Pichia kluyveri TaxID=36015 RepID=A0AAV5R3N4_PICKL|nr:aspartate--tRNA ligase [Pichia kluyveri]
MLGFKHTIQNIHRRYIHITTRKCMELPEKNKTIDKFDFKQFTHTIEQVNKSFDNLINEKITINGWIEGSPRKISKSLVFAKFRDFNGEFTQIVTKSEKLSKLLRTMKPEDALSVTGTVNVKQQKNKDDKNTWELAIDNFQVLNQSNEKASQLDSLKSLGNQFPPEYRYLQLRLPYYQNALKMRARVAAITRDVLTKMSFTEIETPLLFKSTPEGAKEFLVPTRKNGYFYALPQSPQQYKQLLMASGFKGYYQIAKCFRDEDLRADRQPEFTQIDMEMSFAKGEDIQKVVETLVTNVWKDIRKVPLYKVDWENDGKLVELKEGQCFPRLNYVDALSKFGIDKPDLRSNLTFVNVSECFENVITSDEFPVIEACVLKNALNLVGEHTGKKIKLPKELFDDLEYKGRKPFIFKIRNAQELSEWTGKLPMKLNIPIDQLNSKLNLSIGDIVAVSDRSELTYENPTPLGRFRQLSIQNFPTQWRREIAKGSTPQKDLNNIFVAAWLVNFPLFSPVENGISPNEKGYPSYNYEKFESTHHPFTMAKLEDYEYLATEPLKVKGDHYDLVINGVEVGGGSRRVHDAELQTFIFQEILKITKHKELFGHLIHALESGCPPHAGLAIGFDRMCSMLLGSSNIRDVVAFPKTQAGSDPVVQSPSQVPQKTLSIYDIAVINLPEK